MPIPSNDPLNSEDRLAIGVDTSTFGAILEGRYACASVESLASAYHLSSGVADDPRSQSIQQHLAVCEKCRRLWDLIAATDQSARAAAESLDAPVSEEVLAQAG